MERTARPVIIPKDNIHPHVFYGQEDRFCRIPSSNKEIFPWRTCSLADPLPWRADFVAPARQKL
jgi:hypothetical protein